MERKETMWNFEELFGEAVEVGLSSLGDSAKLATYFYLEKGFNLRKQDIPYKVKDFATAIEKFFGVGANFLETLILKQLYEKAGKSPKRNGSEDVDFIKCVEAAKKSISKLEAHAC